MKAGKQQILFVLALVLTFAAATVRIVGATSPLPPWLQSLGEVFLLPLWVFAFLSRGTKSYHANASRPTLRFGWVVFPLVLVFIGVAARLAYVHYYSTLTQMSYEQP